MLKLTMTLAAALYAGFVIWGAPTDVAENTFVAQPAVISTASADFDRPVILQTQEDDAVVTRAAVTSTEVPSAAAIAASAPEPRSVQRRMIGEPVVVSLVRPTNPAPGSTGDAVPREGLFVVTGSTVNMRSGPSTGNAVIDSLVQGTLTEALGEEVDGWIEVRDITTGLSGFMAARFLEPS